MTPAELAELQLLGDLERVRRDVSRILDRVAEVREARHIAGKHLTVTQRDHLGALHDQLRLMQELVADDGLSEEDRAFLRDVARQMDWSD